MKSFLALALCATLCAPAFAQKQGMANNNAPTVTQTVENAGAKISLNYTSISWVRGEFMDAAMDKGEKGARTRKQINAKAKDAPLASFSTSVDLTCGDLKLAAGDYKVSYTINDNTEWEINFTSGDNVQTMKLPLMDSGNESKRLMMCLYAGDSTGAGVYIAFGNKMAMLTFTPGKGEAKKG